MATIAVVFVLSANNKMKFVKSSSSEGGRSGTPRKGSSFPDYGIKLVENMSLRCQGIIDSRLDSTNNNTGAEDFAAGYR